MQVFEVAIGKFVAGPGVLAFVVIYAEIPFLIFAETVPLDEFVFLLGRGLVLAPRISLIMYGLAARDEVSRVLIPRAVLRRNAGT